MGFRLEGKVTVITGGSRGIGKGIGQRLAATGLRRFGEVEDVANLVAFPVSLRWRVTFRERRRSSTVKTIKSFWAASRAYRPL